MIPRVLLIDDDVDEHEIFTSALKNYNSNIICLTANSWAESDTLLKHFRPDVVFIDMNMPITNGIDSLKKIKEIPGLKNARLYVYSAGLYPREKKEALELGALGWIKKPSDVNGYTILFEELFEQEKK
jgi:CheY-like chemotaxis protein